MAQEPADEVELAELRRSYSHGGMDEDSLAADPITQFKGWLAAAVRHKLPEPNAMVVATATPTGIPSARHVLLKGVDERGFVFYTNYGSRKATEIAANPVASLVFPWFPIERQVVVCGSVVRVARDEAIAYWRTRPRESQIGAWASEQSSVVPDRRTLDDAWNAVADRFPEEVPLPDFWGGLRVVPDTVEFWQGRIGRLHDRLRYRRDDDHRWVVERLAP